MKRNVRRYQADGTAEALRLADRRTAISIPAAIARHLENAERISALLSFPPMLLACDADKRREEASALAEENTFLVSLILS